MRVQFFAAWLPLNGDCLYRLFSLILFCFACVVPLNLPLLVFEFVFCCCVCFVVVFALCLLVFGCFFVGSCCFPFFPFLLSRSFNDSFVC